MMRLEYRGRSTAALVGDTIVFDLSNRAFSIERKGTPLVKTANGENRIYFRERIGKESAQDLMAFLLLLIGKSPKLLNVEADRITLKL